MASTKPALGQIRVVPSGEMKMQARTAYGISRCERQCTASAGTQVMRVSTTFSLISSYPCHVKHHSQVRVVHEFGDIWLPYTGDARCLTVPACVWGRKPKNELAHSERVTIQRNTCQRASHRCFSPSTRTAMSLQSWHTNLAYVENIFMKRSHARISLFLEVLFIVL